MKFFFDRNLSEQVAKLVEVFDRESTIVHQNKDGRFAHDTEDEVLIRTLGTEIPKPIWVSADIGQRRKPEERAALIESGMTLVFFRGGYNGLTPHVQAIKAITVWPEVVKGCKFCKAPSIFEVSSKTSSHKVECLGFVRDYWRS